MHPDVSTDGDATTDAAALIAAYTALMVSTTPLVYLTNILLVQAYPILQICFQ